MTYKMQTINEYRIGEIPLGHKRNMKWFRKSNLYASKHIRIVINNLIHIQVK